MKNFFKTLLMYDKIYPMLSKTSFYKLFKKFYGQAAATFHSNPANDFFVIGVTWTNGKTTTVNVLHYLLNKHVGKTFTVSTAYIKIWDEEIFNESKMSSLDQFKLQELFVRAKDEWCQIAIIETTSHGLDQYRFEWIGFDMAVLTNITNDHLEYHGSFDAYVKAKKQLFDWVARSQQTSYAVLNKDDPTWRKRSESYNFDNLLTFWLSSNASMTAQSILEERDQTTCEVSYLGEIYQLKTTLLWRYNIANILTALSAAVLMWVDAKEAVASVAEVWWVLWRMDSLDHEGTRYYIDYAHTEDALDKTLHYLNAIKWDGRLIVLSWCMWDGRDKAKRPRMWALLDKYSDIVVLADEDPGDENRLTILDDVASGITLKKHGKWLFVLPERHHAIQFITDIAEKWDTVFLAGKWHEEVMLTARWRRDWSDRRELETILGIWTTE